VGVQRGQEHADSDRGPQSGGGGPTLGKRLARRPGRRRGRWYRDFVSIGLARRGGASWRREKKVVARRERGNGKLRAADFRNPKRKGVKHVVDGLECKETIGRCFVSTVIKAPLAAGGGFDVLGMEGTHCLCGRDKIQSPIDEEKKQDGEDTAE